MFEFIDIGCFPGSTAGKESACNAGNPSSVPGLGRSPGKGYANPLQYSWASLVAQMIKNPPAMRETWLQSLGWEDGKPLWNSCLEKPMDRGAWQTTVHGVAQSQTRLST